MNLLSTRYVTTVQIITTVPLTLFTVSFLFQDFSFRNPTSYDTVVWCSTRSSNLKS